jgi:hypothetical protein
MNATSKTGGAPRRIVLLALSALGGAAALSAADPEPDGARVSAGLTPEGGRILVEAKGVPAPVPLFFTAAVDESVRLGTDEIAGEMRLRLHVVQGRPEALSLGLSGDGDVTEVSGAGLRDWSVRQASGKRLLDIRPSLSDGAAGPRDLDLVVRTRLQRPAVPGATAVLIAAPGDAVGFVSNISLVADPDVDLRVTSVTGLVALGDRNGAGGATQFVSTGEGRIEAALERRGAGPADADLVGAQLAGTVSGTGAGVDFRLRGQLRSAKAGARLRVLSGRAALSDGTAGDGWHAELVALEGGRFGYDLVAERAGVAQVDLAFAAQVRERGDWRTIDFSMPAGSAVPVRLEGLGTEVEFNRGSPIVPNLSRGAWQGFLPADGSASLSWKPTRAAELGALAFTSSEQTDVRVGAGLLRQSSRLTLRVLQGKLPGVRCRLEGPGEILGVAGTNVVGWKVVPDGQARVLEVRFSRPIEAEGSLTVSSQAELGGFPVRAEPMRLAPEGVVRHSGFVRVANSGAVRLEVADASGMMQLAPSQYPGPAAEEGARQVFVYRFPGSGYSYRVVATEIQPEVGVSEIATYELSETDRVISASLELDVREAPLRDWSIQIPDDYTATSIEGTDVSDYAAETTAAGGYRTLKVLFARAVEGRQLLQVRLEKSQQAAAGDWRLRPIRFPGAKSVRGQVGAVSAPGYRIAPSRLDQLTEVPISYFPRQTPGLQQAWRLRGPEWSADLRVEALGQSVQADVFHLYSIKEGIVYGSVLLNYFVVGAPAGEWRIEVPPSVGNIDVVGQNVRHDWRREGNQVVVSLHQPVLGAATLLVTFEQPMSARGGTIEPGQVRPLGVQAERGFIEVVSPLQVKFDLRRAEGGLLRLDPLELPTEFRLLSNAPALAVYQYTARPFRLEMGVEWYAQAETADQVVDFARLSSHVSRDGQVVTDAQYFVKTHGRKALRVVLPEGMSLWETRVDNEVANAQVDGGQTLIPLPARSNPNEPVHVALRLGQAAGPSGATVDLAAPRTMAPTVVTEWTLRGDPGLMLVPRGGTASLVGPALTESGFEWISGRRSYAVAAFLGIVALAALLLLSGSGWRTAAGLACCAAAMLGAAALAADALANRRPDHHELTYASSMVSPAEGVSVRVSEVSEWRALLVGWGAAAAAAGVGVSLAALAASRRHPRMCRLGGAAAAALFSAGLLAQHGGAAPFFAVACAAVFLRMFVPGVARWQEVRRADEGRLHPEAGRGAPAVTAALAILIAAGLSAGASPALRAEEGPARAPWLREGAKAAQSMVETWAIRNNRLFGDVELTVRGAPGDSFLLLRPPAILTDFTGEGLRVGKVERDGETSYYVALEREGTLSARAHFEMPVPDPARGIAVATGPAAAQRITLELDQGGWEFTSPMAVQIRPTPGLGEDRSGATLILAPQGAAVITPRPRRRDTSAEATKFYAEAANLYVPGPGAVDGFARVTIRPVQGRVSQLDLDVPAGLTVGDVVRGPVGAWRFDPQRHRLHVAVEPAQAEAFRFDVETQLGAGSLPFALSLEPLRVEGAVGQVGAIAVAFGGDAQSEAVTATSVTPVNIQDFDAGVMPRTREDKPLAAIQNVWRYGEGGGRVDMRVVAVAPEVRVTVRQVLSLDDDRMVMAVDLAVSISRAGLFKLSFPLPEGLELEALSGPALSQWTEAEEGARRVVTMHLSGRTIGETTFAATLAGPAPRPQDAWAVPGLAIREAGRQTGEALLVPGKGLRLRAAERARVTQIDPASAGGLQPGTLAFRLLEGDWELHVGIEALEPWVTVQALQEVTVREGQTLTRIGIRCHVENAAVKQLRVRIPGIGEERAKTVRASGPAVSDMVRVAGSPDLWEVRFQRGIAGETDAQIEFQGPAAGASGPEMVMPPEFPGARQAAEFVAIRGGGRLELEADTLPRGWARADWGAVAPGLQARSDRSVPALCFRVAEPEGALAVTVRRHDIAEALKLRVTQADLATVFSPEGASLTSVELKVDVQEKGTLRVRLPGGARLFNTIVNGEGASVVREGDAYLFHVAANTDADRSATVRLVYSASGSGSGPVELAGPSLSVPLENVTWRVVMPPGYTLGRYRGDLLLRDERAAGMFGIEQYRKLVESRRSADAQKAVAMLAQADSLLQSGDQQRAGEMLSRASNAQLDEASNEDARVQLRNLRTQQTILGLNTRRQRLYLDNRVEAARNEQLEQAASLNPFMRGKVNFDPQQVDQLLMGNTEEENAALHGIAARLVDQQLAAEPAPGAIDVTLPERGRVLTFTRSLQVNGGAPLELRLSVGSFPFASLRFGLLAMLVVGAITALSSGRAAAEPRAGEKGPASANAPM